MQVVYFSYREDKVNADYIDIRLVEEDDEFEDAKFRKCKKPQWAESKSQQSSSIKNQSLYIENIVSIRMGVMVYVWPEYSNVR